MENLVCTNGIFTTIANVIGFSAPRVAGDHKRPTSPKHELITTLRKDLIAAQAKVLRKYQRKGLI